MSAAVQQILKHIGPETRLVLDTCTEVALTGGKANAHKGRVTKVTTGVQCVTLGGETYERLVKAQMLREGLDPAEFEVSKRKWGVTYRQQCCPDRKRWSTLRSGVDPQIKTSSSGYLSV